MSRTSAFLLMLLLLAVAGITWVFFAGGDALRDEIAPEDLERTGGDSAPPPLVEERGPGLAGSGTVGDLRRRRKPLWPVLPSDQIPRGTLEVLPVYGDETPVDPSDVRIRLVREGSPFPTRPLGVPDRETGVWRFEKVIIGWLRVIAVGDHVRETITRAEISKGQVEQITVVVERAGSIAFQAELYSGERPETITLELRHPETKKPLEVYWAMRAPDAHSSPRKATRVDIGAAGVIFPVPPGRWILHAMSPAGEIDQVDLQVEAGETTSAEIKLRK